MVKNPSYKEEQIATRAKLKARKVLWSGDNPLNLGINNFKRNNAGSYYRRTYKEHVWKELQEEK